MVGVGGIIASQKCQEWFRTVPSTAPHNAGNYVASLLYRGLTNAQTLPPLELIGAGERKGGRRKGRRDGRGGEGKGEG